MAKKEDVLKKLEALERYERVTAFLDKEQDKVIEGEQIDEQKDQIDMLRQKIAQKHP